MPMVPLVRRAFKVLPVLPARLEHKALQDSQVLTVRMLMQLRLPEVSSAHRLPGWPL